MARGFADLNRDPTVRAELASVYASPDDIDVWLGGLVETALPGALVGETIHTILSDQFERLRDGDRFWYQSYLPSDLVRLVERQTLAVIIERHTEVAVRGNPFLISARGGGRR